MVLIIGNSQSCDVECSKLVVKELEKKGHKHILFEQDKCLEGAYLTFEIQKGRAKYFIISNGKKYDVDDFSIIWYLKPFLPRQLLQYDIAEYRAFIHKQFFSMREAIWTVFKDKKWLNDPWAIHKADNKIYQLKTAIDVGFDVPDTIITSNPDEVKEFYAKNDENIIVKVFAASPMLDKALFTNKVTAEYMKKIDSVKMSPAIFQSIIPKDYELRITVVGEKIFAVKINSQEDEETALDWRRKPKLNDFEVTMEMIDLPMMIEDRILKFMKNMGLRFGCIDMIVPPEGEYVFLEINPNGQWYFIQLKTEAQIAKAIADLLMS